MPESLAFTDSHPDLAPLAAAVAAQLDRARTDLADLVALPSVHGAEPGACAQARDLVRDLLAELPVPGLGPESVEVLETTDGSHAVFAHRPAAPGRPTVLLYSHYDVQPSGDPEEWTSPPWELTERGGRWYGRGAADCKGNLVVHLTALRALAAVGGSGAGGDDDDDERAAGEQFGADPLNGLGIRLVVEGSEETGGGGLDDLVAEGRAAWHDRSDGRIDLASIAARSRVTEAEALTDPAGLGGFRVLEWSGWRARAAGRPAG